MLLTLSYIRMQMYAVVSLLRAAFTINDSAIDLLFMPLVDPAYFGRVGSSVNMVGKPSMPSLLAALTDLVPIWLIFGAAGVRRSNARSGRNVRLSIEL